MADLEELAQSSLAQVRGLGGRAAEVEAHVAAVRAAVHTAIHEVETDFTALTSPHDGLLARLEASRNKLSEQMTQTVGECSHLDQEVTNAAVRLRTEHQHARERLADLRERVLAMTRQLEKVESDAQKALSSSQQRGQALLEGLTKAFDATETHLRETFISEVKSQQRAVEESQRVLHDKVAQPMVSHLQSLSQDFANKIQGLAESVGQMAARLGAQTQKTADVQMGELEKRTAVNFQGGQGPVVQGARERADQLVSLAQRRQKKLEEVRARLSDLSLRFKEASGQADSRFTAVANATNHLEQVIQAAE